jgi:nicotinate-nucleotide pyrophosphorylase (carboxylating)
MKHPDCHSIIQAALAEDIGSGDATTLSLVPADALATALVVSRQAAVVCGVEVAAETFRQLDPQVQVEGLVNDGGKVGAGDPVLRVHGKARALLTGERVALNFLQRLSGIATQTSRYVEAVKPYLVQILDTRKTTPLLRALEKYAVVCGGGANHRFGLFDRVMMKDNHLAFWAAATGAGLDAALAAARQAYPELAVEVEVDRLEQLDEVLPSKPDWVLLDNMTPEQVRICVERCRGICKVEVSGGITLETVAHYADTGADAISVGALTHSVTAIDFGLDWEET